MFDLLSQISVIIMVTAKKDSSFTYITSKHEQDGVNTTMTTGDVFQIETSLEKEQGALMATYTSGDEYEHEIKHPEFEITMRPTHPRFVPLHNRGSPSTYFYLPLMYRDHVFSNIKIVELRATRDGGGTKTCKFHSQGPDTFLRHLV